MVAYAVEDGDESVVRMGDEHEGEWMLYYARAPDFRGDEEYFETTARPQTNVDLPEHRAAEVDASKDANLGNCNADVYRERAEQILSRIRNNDYRAQSYNADSDLEDSIVGDDAGGDTNVAQGTSAGSTTDAHPDTEPGPPANAPTGPRADRERSTQGGPVGSKNAAQTIGQGASSQPRRPRGRGRRRKNAKAQGNRQ